MSELDEPDARTLAEALNRLAHGDYDAWAAQAAGAGWCSRPVRLTGRTHRVDPGTGEITATYTTIGQPDGVLLKACGTRRSTLCPACADLYRRDARHLLIAGLQGGKGTSEHVADRPTIFATLTAPSYGPVHNQRHPPAPCRPHPSGTCRHGRERSCHLTHAPGDRLAGSPLCPDCYDHAGTVLFNALAGSLWRRTIIAARRHLAARLGIPASRLGDHAAINYAKVVEYQQRGVVHLHVLARLDPAGTDSDDIGDEALLADVLARAARHARIPDPLHAGRTIRWGAQLDLTPLDADQRRRAAGYVAKYATKSTDPAGTLDHRLRHPDTIDTLNLTDHQRRLVRCAWDLGNHPDLAHLNLHAWAHTLGYRGHWLTKSRGWSTTFGALRDARHRWQVAHHGHDPDQPTVGDWTYKGSGHATTGDTWLAHHHGANQRQARRTAWEER